MPIFQVVPIWNQASGGVSEKYISKQISNSSFASFLTGVIVARSNLMFANEHKWLGVRVSILPTDLNVKGAGRESRVYLVGDNDLDTGGKFTLPAAGSRTELTGAVETPDQLRSVLQMRVKYDDTRSTIKYLSGIADGVSATEPGTFTFARNLDWANKFKVFTDFLVANCQVIALLNTGDYAPVQSSKLSLEAAAPSRLIVSVLTAAAKNVTQGDQVKLTKFRRKAATPGSSLNGTFYVDAVSTTLFTGMTSYTLRGTEGQNPDDWKVLGTVRKKGFGYFVVQKVDPYRVGIHKRGRPILAPRGRSRTRIKLDP